MLTVALQGARIYTVARALNKKYLHARPLSLQPKETAIIIPHVYHNIL